LYLSNFNDPSLVKKIGKFVSGDIKWYTSYKELSLFRWLDILFLLLLCNRITFLLSSEYVGVAVQLLVLHFLLSPAGGLGDERGETEGVSLERKGDGEWGEVVKGRCERGGAEVGEGRLAKG
jgi:hypothetical protein